MVYKYKTIDHFPQIRKISCLYAISSFKSCLAHRVLYRNREPSFLISCGPLTMLSINLTYVFHSMVKEYKKLNKWLSCGLANLSCVTSIQPFHFPSLTARQMKYFEIPSFSNWIILWASNLIRNGRWKRIPIRRRNWGQVKQAHQCG